MANTIPGLPVGTTPSVERPSLGPRADRSEFLKTLDGAVQQVEQLRTDASSSVERMLAGDGQDVHSAMIAAEKAGLAFEMMLQVRNKVVQAYLEISRMPF